MWYYQLFDNAVNFFLVHSRVATLFKPKAPDIEKGTNITSKENTNQRADNLGYVQRVDSLGYVQRVDRPSYVLVAL